MRRTAECVRHAGANAGRRGIVVGLLTLVAVFALSLGACKGTEASARAPVQSALTIDTERGPKIFMVEVAADPDSQREGLMFRKSLPADAGMLFSFGADEPRSFWMKNTFIPLDMLFIRSTGEIVAIKENAVPLNERPISPPEPASAVLEATRT
jgi:uncharacterized membrane protein (UPF0127 family)